MFQCSSCIRQTAKLGMTLASYRNILQYKKATYKNSNNKKYAGAEQLWSKKILAFCHDLKKSGLVLSHC